MLGEHPFLSAVRDESLRYTTWHVTSATSSLVSEGKADVIPLRLSQVESTFDRLGIDVALVRVSPPEPDGTVSLGPSMAYTAAAIERAGVVIGEIDESLPSTSGPTHIPIERFSALVPSESPTPVHVGAMPDTIATTIAEHVASLLPQAPVLQIGLGRVPEALVSMLLTAGLGPLRFVGMGTDQMADLAESGMLASRDLGADHGSLCAVELMGSERLLKFADRNPSVTVHSSRDGHNAAWLAHRFERFVSINSAIEVDLHGQASSEVLSGRQMSGIGGSADFADAARLSTGGFAIIAIPSVARDGTSRIVPQLPPASVVTLPRHAYAALVTEYGIADLRGLPLQARVEKIVSVAHPKHRDFLWERWRIMQHHDGRS